MINRPLWLLAASLLILTPAHAQIVHRYDFNSANDTIGTANGTLAGAASISGGLLNLTGANADSLKLTAAATSGLTGNFSIELFATRAISGGNFSNFFSFANDNNNFLLLNPDRAGSGTQANFKQAGVNGGNELGVASVAPSAFPQNVLTQVVLTYDGTTGAINLYRGGSLIANNTLLGFSLAGVSNSGTLNGIGGNTPFNDPTFNGSFSDFRIYSQALTSSQVTTLNGLGPDATNAAIAAAVVPEPSTWAVALVGVATLLGLRRARRSVS